MAFIALVCLYVAPYVVLRANKTIVHRKIIHNGSMSWGTHYMSWGTSDPDDIPDRVGAIYKPLIVVELAVHYALTPLNYADGKRKFPSWREPIPRMDT